MTINEMMNAISKNPEAEAMANKMLSKADRELSFSEVITLIYNKYCK